MTSTRELQLQGFTFGELFYSQGLNRLDQRFLQQLATHSPSLHEKLLAYRQDGKKEEGEGGTALETSELLIECASLLQDFLADLFQIQEAVAISEAKTTSSNPLSTFKKYFVLRRARKEAAKADTLPPFAELNAWLDQALTTFPLQTTDRELAIALLGTSFLEKPDSFAEHIEKLVQWCTRALTSPEGQALVGHWTSFRLPQPLHPAHLVPTIALTHDGCQQLAAPPHTLRLRDGFKLTDPRMSAREVQNEVNYCIYCHDHAGDFCSKGFPVKKGEPDKGFRKNALDVTLTGCPLEEKISEMQWLKREGKTIAALAMVMVDNPLCPATGHRICNDCMKACIYQKQDPVNIPQIETRVLTDVLDLPFGVEIYDLLTRWNPLRNAQWVMKPYNGLKVMIAGMGPAGFTLAHHLLLEGFAVVGFDGLKIEPLPDSLIKQPLYRYADLTEALDERVMAGFGGVAEYGITVRWDKNFLKLIYLSLLRRPYFQVFGSVRFGGTLTVEDAWKMGFDHLAVAVGAGLPKALPIPGSLAIGMRQANDFLMALQLGNAAKQDSLTSLQIRLPAVVIGGGLTGVDTATELQAYYITLVEKTLRRHEKLTEKYGPACMEASLDAASRDILADYLRHGLAVRKEREQASAQGRPPDFIRLIREWGGVTIAYRRSMQESPAYIHNHEELRKALEEGIYYMEGLEPASVELDLHQHAQALICRKRVRNEANEWVTTAEEIRLPALSILAATGTQPNTAYEFEHKGTFSRLNLQYLHHEATEDELSRVEDIAHCKHPQFGPFTSYRKHERHVSLIGDTHPVFHGSVVKAIASGMRTYPKILTILKNKLGQTGDEQDYQSFAESMRKLFQARVHAISRKTSHVLELTIEAPLAARHFQPGQFYRLQNFETLAPRTHHTLLQMEPLALAASECDREKGTLTFIVTETTASAKLCALLKQGEAVSLMGPTGVRAKIPAQPETVLIIGNASSFAFVRSYGPLMRQAGHRIIYLCMVNNKEEVYCQSRLEKATDSLLWLTKEGESLTPQRRGDYAASGDDLITAMLNYAQHAKETASAIPLSEVDRIFIMGETSLLRLFQASRKTLLENHFIKSPKIFGSVYGNMQCMLKGVCAQCLQWQVDPKTGQRTKAVFACSWQDQPLEIIDIDHIDARLWQNRLASQLSNAWVDYVFSEYEIQRV